MRVFQFAVLALALLQFGCEPVSDTETDRPSAWRAQTQDPYAYLTDPGHPETLRYKAQEADYTALQLEAWRSQIAQYRYELNQILPTQRATPPVVINGATYFSEVASGYQYPVFYRQLEGHDTPEVLLDVNQRVGASDAYRLGGFAVSVDGQWLAFTEDRQGADRYILCIRHLQSGRVTTLATDVAEDVVWLGDQVLFVSGRSVRRVSLSGEVSELYRETDATMNIRLHAGSPPQIVLESHAQTEVWLIEETGRLNLIAPRKPGHRYRVLVADNSLYILTNYWRATFDLARAPMASTAIDDWQRLQTAEGQIIDFDRIGNLLVVHERLRLQDRIVLFDVSTGLRETLLEAAVGESFELHSVAEVGEYSVANCAVTACGELRLWHHSLTQPSEFVRYPLAADAGSPVLTRTAGSVAVEERWYAVRDDVQVPVTLLYDAAAGPLKARPMLVTAYGAYGVSLPRRYQPAYVPYLSRGFIVAMIHVRGGGELGAAWHQAGTAGQKRKSFDDFIDVTRALVNDGYGHEQALVARGTSAGGTIMGFVTNEAPRLFSALSAHVPFVDVLTSLLDVTARLTPADRLEWGDPTDAGMAAYIKSYSPYEQVRAQPHPNLLIFAAANDQRVPVHEAYKWLANLRESETQDALMLIDIEQNSGHLGVTDQYLLRQQQALEMAFFFNSLGLEE